MTGRSLIRWSPFANFWPWEMIYCLRVGMNTVIHTSVYMSNDPPHEFTHYARADCPPDDPEPTRHQFRPS
jgi:hypothetical protein